MNNKDICTKFANGATKGKASNIFIDGDTIYSYGRHFPMATRRINKPTLITYRTYSSSTQRQLSHLKWALRDQDTIEVYNPNNGIGTDDLRYWNEQKANHIIKADRARKPSMIELWNRWANDDQAMIDAITAELTGK